MIALYEMLGLKKRVILAFIFSSYLVEPIHLLVAHTYGYGKRRSALNNVDKCQECGKEYNPDDEMESKATPTCDSCGATLCEPAEQADFESEGEEHLIEKGLRKIAGGITGDKK